MSFIFWRKREPDVLDQGAGLVDPHMVTEQHPFPSALHYKPEGATKYAEIDDSNGYPVQVIGSIKTAPAYRYSQVATADVLVKGSPGILHSVTFSENDAAPTAGSIIIYDSLSEAGLQVFNHTFTVTPFVPFTVILDYQMLTGIFLGFTTTADVNVSCAYL